MEYLAGKALELPANAVPDNKKTHIVPSPLQHAITIDEELNSFLALLSFKVMYFQMFRL